MLQAYKVVDKTTLNGISPTCLSELFRSLIDNEISSQVRATSAEAGQDSTQQPCVGQAWCGIQVKPPAVATTRIALTTPETT